MADTTERLITVYEANIDRFDKNTKQAERIFDRTATSIERRNDQMSRRLQTGFGGRGQFRGPNLDALIGRYTAWGAVIGAGSRLVRESIEVNDEAAKSYARLEETISRLANTAGPAVAGFFDGLNEIIKRDISDLEKLAALWERIRVAAGGMPSPRTSGIPLASAATPFAGFDKKSGNWTPSPLGFPTPGVTDVTPPKPPTGKTVAEREQAIYLDTMKILQDLIAKRHEAADDFRRRQGEEGQELRNRSGGSAAPVRTGSDALGQGSVTGFGPTELAELKDFHARANAAWDSFYERQAEMAESAYDERLRHADTFFGSLATLTRSSSEELQAIGKAAAIIQATIDGVLAVQKALASAPPPLNFALAAAVGVATAANVAAIAGMEKGGRVSAGTPYIVGEKRPELFVPDTAGRIIPRIPTAIAAGGKRAGSHGPITITIDARYAGEGVAQQIGVAVEGAMRRFERRLPRMMDIADRDHR